MFNRLQLVCVYVELDNEDVGKQVSEYFGVDGETPSVCLRRKPLYL